MERGRELAIVRQCLDSVSAGTGSTVLIEAPAGRGKSALARAAHEMAAAAGTRVLTAAGSELERDLAFGLAAQLLQPIWPVAPDLEARLPGDPDRPIATPDRPLALPKVLSWQPMTVGGSSAQWRVRSLVQAVQDVARSLPQAAGSGLVLIVDDAQWADAPSLRFLATLSRRIQDLPVALVVASHSSGLRAGRAASALRSAADRVLHLKDLSDESVATLVRRRFADADPELSAACAGLTGGNPFLVAAILDQLAQDGQAPTADPAARLAEQIPEQVARSVAARLDALPQTWRRTAHAIAVLGPAATVARVARLESLPSRTILEAADALAESDLLAPELPLAFAQPLIAAAVLASLPPFTRARTHRSAAKILIEQEGDPQEIAEHLLRAPPDDDPSVIASLRAAAHLAVADDDPERAVALLVRALSEGPAPDLRVALLTELARAEIRTQRLTVRDRVSEAIRLDVRPARRAELALANGHALYAHGRFQEAAEVLELGVTELGDADEDLSCALKASYVAAAILVGGLSPRVRQMRDELLAGHPTPPTPLQRAAVAHTLIYDALLGTARSRVRELAELAWGDGALRDQDDVLSLSSPLLCAALVLADELERAIEIVDAVQDDDEHRLVPAVGQTLACIRAWALFLQGNVAEAEAGASAVLAGSAVRPVIRPAALALLAACHLEAGRPEQADEALELMGAQSINHPVYDALHHAVRADLRLAQHRAQEALQDAVQAGLVMERIVPDATPGLFPWRSSAALAHLALRQPERARAHVTEELTRAADLAIPRVVTRDLRILGLALNSDGTEELARAVQTGDRHPARLEHARALVDYGAALRRGNRRGDAREPLRRGLDLSHQGGATALESRARTELVAAGARPRRAASTGVRSLTASQRRVADLAARGLTTRQVADALFVTPKTVEFHLRQIYIKLEVTSRDALAEALRAT